MADWLLVGLQLQMTNNIRDLLAALLRHLTVDLHRNFLALLAEDGPTAGRGGKFLVGDMTGPGPIFHSTLQAQQRLAVVRTWTGTDWGPWLTFKPNARSLARPLTGRGWS